MKNRDILKTPDNIKKDIVSQNLSKIDLDILREKERESQCRYRINNVCQLVTRVLGWRDGMPIENCDECFNAGIDSQESDEIREEYVKSITNTVKAFFSDAQYSENVVEVMFNKHLTPKSAERYLLLMCKKIGKDKSLKYAKIIDKRIKND